MGSIELHIFMVCLVWCVTAKTLITIESVLIKVMSLVIRINALCILIMKVPFLLWLVCIHKVPILNFILKKMAMSFWAILMSCW